VFVKFGLIAMSYMINFILSDAMNRVVTNGNFTAQSLSRHFYRLVKLGEDARDKNKSMKDTWMRAIKCVEVPPNCVN